MSITTVRLQLDHCAQCGRPLTRAGSVLTNQPAADDPHGRKLAFDVHRHCLPGLLEQPDPAGAARLAAALRAYDRRCQGRSEHESARFGEQPSGC